MTDEIGTAVRRQIEHDSLDELIEAAEREHGPLTAEEIDAKRQLLASTRAGAAGPMPIQWRDPSFLTAKDFPRPSRATAN